MAGASHIADKWASRWPTLSRQYCSTDATAEADFARQAYTFKDAHDQRMQPKRLTLQDRLTHSKIHTIKGCNRRDLHGKVGLHIQRYKDQRMQAQRLTWQGRLTHSKIHTINGCTRRGYIVSSRSPPLTPRCDLPKKGPKKLSWTFLGPTHAPIGWVHFMGCPSRRRFRDTYFALCL